MPRESAGFPQRVKARLVPAPGALPLGLGGCLLCTELIQQHPGLRRSLRDGAAPSSQGSPGGLVPAQAL